MRKPAIRILMLLVIVLALSTCAPASPEKSWSLIGTWINQSYETTGAYAAKIVYASDGTVSAYKLVSDTTPESSGTFVIDDDWTETGIHWFKVKGTLGATTYYEIDKLTSGGNDCESVFTTTAYPAQFDPTNPAYGYTTRSRL